MVTQICDVLYVLFLELKSSVFISDLSKPYDYVTSVWNLYWNFAPFVVKAV